MGLVFGVPANNDNLVLQSNGTLPSTLNIRSNSGNNERTAKLECNGS